MTGDVFARGLAGLDWAVVGSRSAPPPPPEKTQGLLWNRSFLDAETASLAGTPIWANYRVLAIALLAATFVIVWRFA